MYEAIPLESEKYLRKSLIEQQNETIRRRRIDVWTGFVTFLATLLLIPVMAFIILTHEVWWPIVSKSVISLFM